MRSNTNKLENIRPLYRGDFECTKDLAPLREFIGQSRAIRAIEFGLSMNQDGYNIYVAGLSGTGKTSMVKNYITRLLQKKL